MKKIKFLAPVLAMFTLLLFSSCKKDAEVYWTAIGTISDVTSPSSFVFHDDNGVVINIAKTPFVMSLEYQGKRASMTFTRTDAVVQEGDKVMNGTVVYMDFIKTKDVVSLNQYPTEEERKKELGMQYITPAKAWFGGGYLNLIYHAGFSDLNAKREISLAIDGEKSTTDNIYASLYYKADDANNDYYFSNFADGMIDFNMKSFINPSHVVTLTISYIDAESRREDVLVIKSDNSITSKSAASYATPERINFTQE